MTNFREQTIDLMHRLLDEVGEVGIKHDLATGFTLTSNYMHGTGGIFGVAGIEQDIFATRVKPRGLMKVIPALANEFENPLVGYLTGFTDDEDGAEKSAVCDVPLETGDIKSCLQGALFGRYERKTKPLEINKAMRKVNRGEMFDLRLVNDPVLESGFSVPGIVTGQAQDVLNRMVLALWLNLGVAFERKLGPQIYTGTPANNSVGGGYMEFHGLETLVGTGKIDVITGTTCPALDSYLSNWNYARLDVGSNAATLFRRLTVMYRYVKDIASRTGLDPAVWAFAMRRNLFDELADLWPCAYATYRCQSGNVTDAAITNLVVDANAQRAMSDQLRQGEYLMIDGDRVPVIIDDFIPEDSNTTNANVTSGCFASDIYLLPLTVRGGMTSLFLEYFDFSSPNGTMQAIADGRLGSEFWSDGGRFLWTFQKTGWCVEWWAKIEPRLRLLTPHLAARLQNVQYCPVQHFREDVPGSSYFFDGGEVGRSVAPYNADDFPAAQA